MFQNKKAMASYGAVKVQTGAAYADGVMLTQMLFDGLIDQLSIAEGHMLRQEVAAKHACIDKALKIIFGLQGTLDFERGEQVAVALNDLYLYAIRTLTAANAGNDVEALRKVRGFLDEVRNAWAQLARERATPAADDTLSS